MWEACRIIRRVQFMTQAVERMRREEGWVHRYFGAGSFAGGCVPCDPKSKKKRGVCHRKCQCWARVV